MKEMVNHSFSVLETFLPVSENPILKSMKDNIIKVTDARIYSTCAQLLENRVQCSNREQQLKYNEVSDAESTNEIFQDTRQMFVESEKPLVQSAIHDTIEVAGNYLFSSLHGSSNENDNSLEPLAKDIHHSSTESPGISIPSDLD